MRTENYILTLGFLLTLIGCDSATTKEKKVERIPLVSSLTKVNGSYKLDTFAILTHRNLEPLLEELEKAEAKTYEEVKDIPIFISGFLKNLTGDGFSMADKGEDWQSGCVRIKKLPDRQLIYFDLADNIAILTYFTGGIGVSEHILIIKFTGKEITDFWCGNVLEDLTTKEQTLKYIRENKNKEWGLGTNIIYL
jgi:hypothetical protein